MANVWDLRGTPAQNAIVEAALAACDFPFERLLSGLLAKVNKTSIPVEWADLSRWNGVVKEAMASGGHAHIHEDGDTADPIAYRERVLGLAWYSGKVSLDLSLESNPRLAQEVFLSEGAHMIDFFLMTDQDRQTITDLLHAPSQGEHGHGWFDVGTYEEWVGEAWMGVFTGAFAPTVGVTLTQFVHRPEPADLVAVRRMFLPAEEPPAPPAPPVAPDPLAGFPYTELDEWAKHERTWWAKRNRLAAQAYRAWRGSVT